MHNLSGIEMQFSVCMPTSGSSMGKAGTGLGWVLYLSIQGAGSSTLTVQGAGGTSGSGGAGPLGAVPVAEKVKDSLKRYRRILKLLDMMVLVTTGMFAV